MEWLERMNRAVNLIEDNLTGEIDLRLVAQAACCSSYDFQRIFCFITDVSVTEYIRRRRLTLAAFDLQSTEQKVIDIGLRYGYTSPVSFSRAFRALHGLSPAQVRDAGVRLKAYPRMSFQISIRGGSEMEYRIEKKEAFRVFGIETLISNEQHPKNSVGAFWRECQNDGRYDRLFADAGDGVVFPEFKSMCRIHGAMGYRETPDNSFSYLLCAFVTPGARTDGYVTADIPAATWAVFPSGEFKWEKIGAVIGDIYKRLYSEWLPTSNYEKTAGPEFEMYGGTAEMGQIEIWIPVVKKGSNS